MNYKTFTFENNGREEDSISILFIAGIHGNEVNTVMAAYQMINMLEVYNQDIHDVSKITIVPLVNVEGFRMNQREFVSLYSDLNRCHDTSRGGDIRKELHDLIEDHDIVIDMHCSQDFTAPMFYLSTFQDNRELYGLIKYFEACGINYLVSSSVNDTLKATYSRPGKLVLTFEVGGMEYDEDSIAATIRMMQYVIKYGLDILQYVCAMYTKESLEKMIVPESYQFRTGKLVNSPAEGIFVGSDKFTSKSIIHDLKCGLGCVQRAEIPSTQLLVYKQLCRTSANNLEMRMKEVYYESSIPASSKIMQILNMNKYIPEGALILQYQPSNCDIVEDYDDVFYDIIDEMDDKGLWKVFIGK